MDVDARFILATRIAITLIWIVICWSGLRMAWGNWQDARRDLAHLRRSGKDGILMMEATGGVGDQLLIVQGLVADLLAGLVALAGTILVTPVVPARASVIGSITGTTIAVLLTLAAVSMTRLSFAKARRRKAQINALLMSGGPLWDSRELDPTWHGPKPRSNPEGC